MDSITIRVDGVDVVLTYEQARDLYVTLMLEPQLAVAQETVKTDGEV